MLGMEAALRTTTVACKEGHSTRKSPRGKVPATQPYHEGFANRNDLLGSVPISYASAPEPVFARGKARGAKFGRSKYATRNAASRKNRPGPKGCAANVAMRRCGTWQGSDHCLRPAPCGTPPGLATFAAATRSATKREQTLTPYPAKRDAEFTGFLAGMLAEITAEIGAVGESQFMGDLFDFPFRVRQLPLRFSDGALVDHRCRRFAQFVAADTAQRRRRNAQGFRIACE